MFGEAVAHWNVQSNPYGFDGTIIVNGPDALEAYQKEVFEYAATTSDHISMIQIWGQVIGHERDIIDRRFYDTFDYFNSTYFGFPVIAMYGEPTFQFLSLEDQSLTSAELYYLIVPVLDGVAAGLNYNAWEDTQDDWKTAYIA